MTYSGRMAEPSGTRGTAGTDAAAGVSGAGAPASVSGAGARAGVSGAHAPASLSGAHAPASLLIVGGYGIVGAQVARILRRRNPSLRILIAGRTPEKARALAAELGHAEGVRFDVDDPGSLARLAEPPQLILLAVNDLRDVTLNAAIAAGTALVDITRWTARVRDLEAICKRSTLRAPVVQGSAWMACIPGALALASAASLESVDSIDISILYALKDKSGDDSVEYMDRLTVPFPVIRDGQSAMAIPFTESREATFANGHATRVYRFDTPDQHILPRRAKAKSVAAFIAFDDRTTMRVFWLIVRSGLWDLMSGERFTKLRRGLLHNPGPGAPHHVRVDIAGTSGGKPVHRTIQITDPAGQTHLTAVGAALQAEWVLGLNGFAAIAPGLQYGEDIAPSATLRAALESEAIAVLETP